MPRTLAFSLTLLVPLLCTDNVSAAGKGGFGQKEYVQAHGTIREGKPYDGAVQLIELLRQVPGDSVRVADQMVGPAQLLGFSIASLMDWPDRTRLLTEVLKPEEYESDKLLIAVMQAGSGVQSMAFSAAMALEKLTKSDNQAISATTLCILAEPYYYRRADLRSRVTELALKNPDLEAAQCVLESPIIRALRDARQKGAADGRLLKQEPDWNGESAAIFKVAPGLARMAQVLPSMDATAITDDTITALGEGLKAETAPRIRYTTLGFLASVNDTPERRTKMRGGLEALAALPPQSADVLRARMILVENGCADHEPDAVKAQVLAVLRLEVLPCTADRSMYEASMQAAQKAAKYFTRFGYFEDAVLVHKTLAAKYPNSTLAQSELGISEKLRSDPTGTAMSLIRAEAEAPKSFGKFDEVRRLYQGVLNNAENPELKAALARELQGIPAVGQSKISQ